MKKQTSKSPRSKTSTQPKSLKHPSKASTEYPFSAIVGQDEMKLAMILNVIDAKVGGVLIMGHRGTGKSTAVRALGDLLPAISFVAGCPYRCDPEDEKSACDECRRALDSGAKVKREKAAVRVVELPLGATEDRVCGTIDIEQALRSGVRRFEPGLLARANRGFLYIDEVNLLEDHLVDLLLDVSATGVNNVEREGISVRHPARFVLIGSGNPEEGELRPQLLDRFGLYVEVTTEGELDHRVEIVERRQGFENDRELFLLSFAEEQNQLRRRITRAEKSLAGIKLDRQLLKDIARVCAELKVDGHRGELTITRAARALAAFEGRKKVNESDVRRVAVMSLRHRLRRDVLDEVSSVQRIEEAMDKVLGQADATAARSAEGDGDGAPSAGRRVDGSVSSVRASTAPGGNGNRNREPVPAGQLGADAPPTIASPVSESARELKLKLKLDRSQSRGFRQPVARFVGSRQAGAKRSVYNAERGRYARSVHSAKASDRIALDATLRAGAVYLTKDAAPWGHTGPEAMRPIPADALRFKLFKRKQGRLFIFAIDLSGSMALNRINHAREMMFGLLRQSYIYRDTVAIIGFRGTTGKVMLPPSKSIVRARRVLETLPMGGGTPLSAGLARSLDLAQRAGQSAGEVVLLLFTDGGANVSLHNERKSKRELRQQLIESEIARLGVALRKSAVTTLLIDTRQGFNEGDTNKIADSLGARFIKL